MSDAWLESCGLKKKQRCEPAPDAFTREDRQDLFEDLLEEDTSVFPLLDVPPEVLTAVGIFLDARHLVVLSQLNVQAHSQLDEALSDAWTEVLLRDYAFGSRAKRYKAFSAASGEAQRTLHGSAGLVLTAVDLCRIEWDGLLVAAPVHLRYCFFDTMRVLKNRWGRLAQSWEWFATRVLRRMTHTQLERFVPRYSKPEHIVDEFDEVSHQASLDRNLRQRHVECNPKDVIASMKRSLGISTNVDDQFSKNSAFESTKDSENSTDQACEKDSDDILSALAPTARDQRAQQAVDTARPDGGPVVMPSHEVVEKMSFSEQLDLALRVSQSAERSADESPSVTATQKQGSTLQQTPSVDTEADAAIDDVLLQLKCSRASQSKEPLEVVLKVFTVGESFSMPEQLRRPVEQVSLRLTKNNWLLFYEGIAIEAQLRARAVVSHLRNSWQNPQALEGCDAVRSCADLEPELLQLPIFSKASKRPENSTTAEECIEKSHDDDERHLACFLEAWEEYEAWTVSLEEHLGPLDLEVGRERTNNLQRGKAHTPYAADLCRLAFRNFGICEARLFFRVAIAVYGLIRRLWNMRASESAPELLEGLCAMAEAYMVEDDALSTQRNTLQEYRYYLLEPLQRARARLLPNLCDEADIDDDHDLCC
jgi:hypothetical protein